MSTLPEYLTTRSHQGPRPHRPLSQPPGDPLNMNSTRKLHTLDSKQRRAARRDRKLRAIDLLTTEPQLRPRREDPADYKPRYTYESDWSNA
jgi:hypothetical protein